MTEEPRGMRADARRNRARVLVAAETVLAREGLGATMRTVAGEAGVGLGTVYRHFPTQAELYRAVITERARRLAERAGPLLTAEDPGEAFFGFLTAVVDDAARNKAMADFLTGAGVDVKEGMEDTSRAMREAVEALMTRAQRAGAVRADLCMPELLALLGALCAAAERGPWAGDLPGRVLGLVYDGCRPRP
ncbi:TetR/AcrR family transcriptional regulator [Streptomyces vietnamensis]|uniref:TetR/AcrR family transcriptional regulator n=1 Tax=Streptomyces vietnamensis TaxID=362257 RepID=UPI00379A328B